MSFFVARIKINISYSEEVVGDTHGWTSDELNVYML